MRFSSTAVGPAGDSAPQRNRRRSAISGPAKDGIGHAPKRSQEEEACRGYREERGSVAHAYKRGKHRLY